MGKEYERGIGLYSSRVAARVARIPRQALAGWARAGLIQPSVHKAEKREESVYSFRDLLLLRLIARLRKMGVPTSNIRTALQFLAVVYGPDGWMKSTLVVEGNRVLAITELPDWRVLDASAFGQKVEVVFFPKLIDELKRELVPEDFGNIEIDPEVMGGAPVVKGTRLPTQLVAALASQGQKPQEIYPSLTSEAVDEAVRYEGFLDKVA